MEDQISRRFARWREAEAQEQDDVADAAFAELFQSVARPPVVSPGFTGRTLSAVATAAERDLRRARRVRRVAVPAAAVAVLLIVYYGSGLIAWALSASVVWLLNLLISAVVTTATAVQSGPDAWSVLSSLGRATAAVIANPAVTVTIFAMQGFAIGALIVLRRLLGADRELFR